jgi:hypothetical protein
MKTTTTKHVRPLSPFGGRGAFIFLLLPLWGLGGLFGDVALAQSTVTVTPIGTDYGEHTVTFLVKWTGAAHNNRVWVWVDYCPVVGVAQASPLSRASIGAVTITASDGSVTTSTGNSRGFFVAQNPATVTATLLDASGQFNWCAYGSGDPPKAVVRAEGGYTLQGAPPFTINETITENTKTFGAGTCIESITDLTGYPEGVVPAPPSLSDPNSPSICSAQATTLFATVSGGVTGAMTYTWDIGGSQDSNQTNSYTTASLSAGTTYSVTATNANNCESSPATGMITVNYPGTDGQAAHPMCGCAEGMTDCSGTCTRSDYYTTNDGACTGFCRTAYVQLRDPCGAVVCAAESTYIEPTCLLPCSPRYDPGFFENKYVGSGYVRDNYRELPNDTSVQTETTCMTRCFSEMLPTATRVWNYGVKSLFDCYCYWSY